MNTLLHMLETNCGESTESLQKWVVDTTLLYKLSYGYFNLLS
jgi:hypothetical protein